MIWAVCSPENIGQSKIAAARSSRLDPMYLIANFSFLGMKRGASSTWEPTKVMRCVFVITWPSAAASKRAERRCFD
jgi:hypothetical protein